MWTLPYVNALEYVDWDPPAEVEVNIWPVSLGRWECFVLVLFPVVARRG
jgi:hypothetical protein